MPDATTEKDLLQLIAAGDEAAFRKLYISYHSLLRTHVYRLTESQESADEIVQDVFLKIWNTREALESIDNFRAYLFVVSKNYTISYLRKHVRQTILHEKWKNEETKAVQKEDGDDPVINYYGLLDEAIDHLSPQQKKVYILSRHQQLKYVEIAEQMGISKETVKSYLQLSVASIAAYIQKKGVLECTIFYALLFC